MIKSLYNTLMIGGREVKFLTGTSADAPHLRKQDINVSNVVKLVFLYTFIILYHLQNTVQIYRITYKLCAGIVINWNTRTTILKTIFMLLIQIN